MDWLDILQYFSNTSPVILKWIFTTHNLLWFWRRQPLNPLSNDKMWDLSKPKHLQAPNYTWCKRCSFLLVGNNVGKAENTGYHNFPVMFSKVIVHQVDKNARLYDKGLIPLFPVDEFSSTADNFCGKRCGKLGIFLSFLLIPRCFYMYSCTEELFLFNIHTF